MTPHIRKVQGVPGVWECFGCYYVEGGGMGWVRGHGYTPQEAYRDWRAQQ